MNRLLIAATFALAAGAIAVAQSPAACTPSGGLTFICGPANPEDLVLVPNTRWMIASGMAPGSGLHLVDTRAKTVKNLYPVSAASARADRTKYANCPGPLDPKQALLHGLSLRPAAAGRYTVYATNHGGRESVEVFELDTSGGGPDGDVGRLRARAGQDVVQQCRRLQRWHAGRYCADHARQDVRGRVRPAQSPAWSCEWTPGTPAFTALPGTELSANNGIETSPDDREFYVASTTTKRVIAFARNNTAKPLRVAQLKEFGPDNVRWTS